MSIAKGAPLAADLQERFSGLLPLAPVLLGGLDSSLTLSSFGAAVAGAAHLWELSLPAWLQSGALVHVGQSVPESDLFLVHPLPFSSTVSSPQVPLLPSLSLVA